MARAGLGDRWSCLFANDFDRKKAETYRHNWLDNAMLCDDICHVTTTRLPGAADLAWASFPCQDLSLAGGGAGLRGPRSGTFWPFWRLISTLRRKADRPRSSPWRTSAARSPPAAEATSRSCAGPSPKADTGMEP